ncbi:KRAB domain-containing zinc finger protein [Sarotherodon galilaeus]
MDLLSIVVDEMALEGLDGITIPTLQPGFSLKLDDCTKELIWKSLVINTELTFYELPEKREDVVLTDRFKDIDTETGIEVTDSFTDTPKDIYPIDVVPENKDGIQGSCAFFKMRKDITKQVHSKSPLTPLVRLNEALERYGRKFVVVASQCLRYRALIGSESDPDVILGSNSYCVLERVAEHDGKDSCRGIYMEALSRWMPESLYFRKSLMRYQLVTMQSYVRRMKTGQQQHSILLLLKCFHVNKRTKYDILIVSFHPGILGSPQSKSRSSRLVVETIQQAHHDQVGSYPLHMEYVTEWRDSLSLREPSSLVLPRLVLRLPGRRPVHVRHLPGC